MEKRQYMVAYSFISYQDIYLIFVIPLFIENVCLLAHQPPPKKKETEPQNMWYIFVSAFKG